ncbi:MAG: hypothetical protein Q9169_004565 [Polycauliona sp. 2 TL-2023]
MLSMKKIRDGIAKCLEKRHVEDGDIGLLKENRDRTNKEFEQLRASIKHQVEHRSDRDPTDAVHGMTEKERNDFIKSRAPFGQLSAKDTSNARCRAVICRLLQADS